MNNHNPLVSLIVPIYNVEPFVSECLDSIISQTYKNIEIILVNDGSTDKSGIIASLYKTKDKRITLINKKNGGLSDARNAGLRIAKGDYLFFVDSDDVLIRDAIYFSVAEITKENADVAIFSYYEIKNNKIQRPILFKSNQIEILDNNVLMLELAKCEKIQNFAWGKLFKRELFDGIEFPLGRYFEDQFIMMSVFSKCKKAIFIDNPKYLYRANNNSISRTLDLKKLIDCIDGFNQKAMFYKNKYPKHLGEMYKNANSIISDIRFRYPIIFCKELRHNIKLIKDNIFSYKKDKVSNLLLLPIFSTIVLRIIENKKIKEFLYRLFFQEKKQKRNLIKLPSEKKVIFFGAPEYDNIGDHAIYLQSKAFFKKFFPEYSFISLTEKESLKNIKNILKQIRNDDLVAIQGGGNMGSIYPQEHLRRTIAKKFCKYKIIIMPVSTNFENSRKGHLELKKSSKIYNLCNKLFLLARDEHSYCFVKQHFSCFSLCCPDIVLLHNREVSPISREPLLCLRDDAESILSKDNKMMIYDTVCNNDLFFTSDDTSTGYLIPTCDGQMEFEKMLNIFRKSKYVITDRLHGMVFAYLCGKKCIVISNSDKKIEGLYKWIANDKNVYFLNKNEVNSKRIYTIINNDYLTSPAIDFEEEFSMVATKIKETLSCGQD